MIEGRAIDLLCLAMAITLSLHANHLPWWLILVLAMTLAGRWWQLRRRGTNVPLWLKIPLVALLLLAVMAWWGTIFGRAPGSALAVGLLILKLLETRRNRDVYSAVAFGCFVLMSALLFNQGMVFTVLVLLGVVPNLAALRAIQPRGPAPGWRREWLPVAGSVMLALPLALFAFLFVPRLASPLWGAANLETARTGLSRSMTPGSFTQLLIDDSPAMRVTFNGPPPPVGQRYFRAWVMDRFDGHTWSHPFRKHDGPEKLRIGRDLSYRIELEPTGGHMVPAMGIPIEATPETRVTAQRTLYSPRPLDQVTDWQVTSAMEYRLAPHLDDREREANLALPEGFDPQARRLAARWRTQFGKDPLAIARAALGMYHNEGFSYTLAPAPLGRNSVDDFLFSTREGFCEQYASSFTFLMRAAGIPARVVTGYQGGYWNASAKYLMVRNSDAHAWAEVWIAGRGWVRFDPTAAVRPDRVEQGVGMAGAGSKWYQARWIRNLRAQWDIVNRLWNQSVIAFNHKRQQGLLTPFGINRTDLGQLSLILAIGCSLLLALATLLALRRGRERDALLAIQHRLERHLARAGVPRQANEGPRDYMQRAGRALPGSRSQLEKLYRQYIHLRYAKKTPTAHEISAYRRLVRESIRRGVVK